jgi:hypothetical protein
MQLHYVQKQVVTTYMFFFIGEITLYPPEVSTHFHFYLQSLKCDTLPPKLSNCGNLTIWPIYSQNALSTFFLSKKKGGRPPQHIFIYFFGFFFLEKKSVGAFWE